MNCENCETQLLDLLYGELDTATSARVREHMDGCASCRAAGAKLESARRIVRQLPLETPPAYVHAALVSRAQAHARGDLVIAPAKSKARVDGEDEQGAVQRFMSWLGGFLLGPQVAMAMVLMLMVGVGLYYLPGLRTPRQVPGGAIVNPDPGDEAGPSAAIQPAEPLDLRLDTRTNRIHSGAQGVVARSAGRADTDTAANDAVPSDPAAGEAQGAIVAGPLPEAPAATLVPLVPSTEAHPAGGDGRVVAEVLQEGTSLDVPSAELALAPGEAFGAGGGNRSAAPVPTGTGARMRAPAFVAQGARAPAEETLAAERPTDQAVAGPRQESVTASDAELRPQVAQASPPHAQLAVTAPAPAPPPPSAPSVMRAPAQPSAPARPAAAPPSGGSYGSGGGATTGGTAPQTQAQSPLLAAAGLHGVARNQASAGAIRDAIGSYESLLSRYAGYDRATEAMLELAELYRRVGDLSRARSWLARAEQVPSYAARARQQRFRVDEMDRARRSVPAAAAPSGN